MPNAPKTPLRNFRAPDDEWLTAKAALMAAGRSISDELRRTLRAHAGPIRIEQHIDTAPYWVVLDDHHPQEQPAFPTPNEAVAEAARRYRIILDHQEKNHDQPK